MAEQKEILFFAVDLEFTGSRLNGNTIISLGICYATNDLNTRTKERINFVFSEDSFDKKCWDEFWSKQTDKLEKMRKNQLLPNKAMRKFYEILDELDEKYDVRILSDCPSNDIALLSHYSALYLDRPGPQFKFGKDFRPIFDTDSYARGAMNMSADNPWTSDANVIKQFGLVIDENIKATHMPDDDAEKILVTHVTLLNKLKSNSTQ